MRKIAVFTGTRAEYGLLFWLMKALQQSEDFQLQLLVSGAHLSPQFGETWQQIESDGFEISEKVEMLLSSDSPIGVVKSLGLATIGYADALAKLSPDLLIVLGDRYETLAIAQTALIMKIPLAHIHGGELTFGAYDDSIRHAITKMASLHFVATESYRKRVLQLGEAPEKVFVTGALGLEHLHKTPLKNREHLTNELKIPLSQPFFLVTYHPATLANEPIESTFQAILAACNDYPEHQILFTYPNADNGGHKIINLLEAYCKKNPTRAFAIQNLGYKNYLSVAACSAAVIGNSSSGIIEIPSLGVPTINIGSRQAGRLASSSVIHSKADYGEIYTSIKQAISETFKLACQQYQNPYDQGIASEKIVSILKTHDFSTEKQFQDVEFNYA